MSDSNRSGVDQAELAEQNNSVSQSPASDAPAEDNKTGADQNRAPPSVEDLAPIESKESQAHSEVTEQAKQDDLQAQQDMAFWAMLMFFATVATVIISGFALLLLKRTLDATATAAEHAETMASEAQKATKAATDAATSSAKATAAMIEANRIASDGAQSSAEAMVTANQIAADAAKDARVSAEAYVWNERAWLELVDAQQKPTRFNTPPTGKALLKNSGKSLAKITGLRFRKAHAPNYELAENFHEVEARIVVKPDDEPIEICELLPDDFSIEHDQFILGFVNYSTLGNATFKTHFCLRVYKIHETKALDKPLFISSGCEGLPPDT